MDIDIKLGIYSYFSGVFIFLLGFQKQTHNQFIPQCTHNSAVAPTTVIDMRLFDEKSLLILIWDILMQNQERISKAKVKLTFHFSGASQSGHQVF